MSEYHIPVLLAESVSALVTNPGGTYADATFGGGGHTAAILSRLNGDGRVIAFDRDIDAIEGARKDPRLTLIHNNFRFIENYAEQLRRQKAGPEDSASASLRDPVRANAPAESSGPAVFDGILADLGVSSHQFDTAERGFSFRFEDAPLDMRMNREAAQSSAEVVNSYPEEELERILRLYGEVDGARNMARLIGQARAQAEIRTTGDLDRAIARMLPRGAEHKVLAKVYQALRIEVNQEMRSLEKFLEGATRSLKAGGRLVVITYHSLEDRMVKNFIKTGNVEGKVEENIYGKVQSPLEAVNRKPILPAEEEIAANTRARSAKLRIAERRMGDE
ncbi:MAG: 16S rRNA (cytosine(1402)-N(4))-methyltransferase RsmH [Bacteroidales bacterium]|nr:16S rRNA (cytosine(1402)-N(4))-methyltransferase RsmH [Bacteroidales bacterium]